MACDIEIIEFVRPEESNKKLFISNLVESPGRPYIQEQIYDHFEKEGIVYEVFVFPACTEVFVFPACTEEKSDIVKETIELLPGTELYAFVTFFSARDAAQARKNLTGKLVLNGKLASIKFARPRIQTAPTPPLYVAKCYELANYFLGFNGWNSNILKLEPDITETEGSHVSVVLARCVVQLQFSVDNLHAEGAAIAKQEFPKNDFAAKGVAVCRAKKQAYQLAMETAFRKLVLVRLCDGRVHLEVNTTVEEQLVYDEHLDKKSMIKVRECTETPLQDSDEDQPLDQALDELNVDLLQQLEQSAFEEG